MSSVVIGVTYINVVILNGVRKGYFFSVREEMSVWNPYNYTEKAYKNNLKRVNWNLESRFKDFYRVLIISVFVYFTTGVCVLRSRYSEAGGVCSHSFGVLNDLIYSPAKALS